jgi:hypothetical protein
VDLIYSDQVIFGLEHLPRAVDGSLNKVVSHAISSLALFQRVLNVR